MFGDVLKDTDFKSSLGVVKSPGNPSSGIFLLADETVDTAEHGFFARTDDPPTEDAALVAFRDNRQYFYTTDGPFANPPDNCLGDCSKRTANAEKWIEPGSDNFSWLDFHEWFENPDANLRVFDKNTLMHKTCLHRGGPCSAATECGNVKLPWAQPRNQEGEYWCWAAVVQSIIYNKTGQRPTQCEIVNVGHEVEDCPEKKPGFPWAVDRALEHWGLDTNWPPGGIGSMSFEDIRIEIDSGRPIMAGIGRKDEGNIGPVPRWWHAVLITGYECDDTGAEWLWIYDIRDREAAGLYNKISRVRYESFVHDYLGRWKWGGYLLLT